MKEATIKEVLWHYWEKRVDGNNDVSDEGEEKEWEKGMHKRFAKQIFKLPVARWTEYMKDECPEPWLLDICYWLTKREMFYNGEFEGIVEGMDNMTEEFNETLSALFLGGIRNLIMLDPVKFDWWLERTHEKSKNLALYFFVDGSHLLYEKEPLIFHEIPQENMRKVITHSLDLKTDYFPKATSFPVLKILEVAIGIPKHARKVRNQLLPHLHQFDFVGWKALQFANLQAEFFAKYGETGEDDQPEEECAYDSESESEDESDSEGAFEVLSQ